MLKVENFIKAFGEEKFYDKWEEYREACLILKEENTLEDFVSYNSEEIFEAYEIKEGYDEFFRAKMSIDRKVKVNNESSINSNIGRHYKYPDTEKDIYLILNSNIRELIRKLVDEAMK